MNSYNQKAVNMQLMPPHWRNNLFYVAVLSVIMQPLHSFYVGFKRYSNEIKKDINITGQVGVLEHYISRKMEIGNRDVFFGAVIDQGKMDVYLNMKYKNKEHILRQALKKYLPAGVVYKVVNF